MYKRVVLAFNGTEDGRAALREGALLARCFGAEIHLISVVAGAGGVAIGDSVLPGAVDKTLHEYNDILERGRAILRWLGVEAHGELLQGDPAAKISAYASRVEADLVVVGHRRRSGLARWWSESMGASLLERVHCSVLISQREIDEATFQAGMTGESVS